MDPTDLAGALECGEPREIVRTVADWIDRALRSPALDLSVEPPPTGVSHVDALLGAATAHVARQLGRPTPPWTTSPDRVAESFWYPGPPDLFPNALVHAPGEFAVRGVFIEAGSLECV